MVARLRLGNKLNGRRGEFTKTRCGAGIFLFARERAHARVVKPIFTLARHYPDRRL
jgi:hypothetical protein